MLLVGLHICKFYITKLIFPFEFEQVSQWRPTSKEDFAIAH